MIVFCLSFKKRKLESIVEKGLQNGTSPCYIHTYHTERIVRLTLSYEREKEKKIIIIAAMQLQVRYILHEFILPFFKVKAC